ncbi:cysteine-rich receptor-like protein kinase 10 [Cryptomeria japonica]|uniref:cysteine-rich receptor-like protein kinase 10 n=1 Tax=Cryptomeria japonica TaxID=3369 RepID=UPI0027DA988C|nr:cysteine-rich receptor-like protein kinase 10 [Cryptomeria japonica]
MSFACFCISLLLIIPCLRLCKAAETYCNTGLNFTDGSKLEQNRNIVVNDLVQHAPSSGSFNSSVSGQSPDQIYGLLQCRGDVTAEECYACSLEMNSTIRRLCAHAATAFVFVNDKCYLSYDTSNFIGKLDNTTQLYRLNGENATDPAAFSSALKGLFSNLSAKVGESPNMYASGFTSEYSQITKIYGLIQCRRDISGEDCKACLGRGIGDLLKVTQGGYRLGGLGWLGSCLVIYQTYPFFAASTSPPPSSTILPSSKESSNKIPIILGSLGGFIVLVLLVGLLFTLRRKLKTANTLHGKDGPQGGEDWPFSAYHRIIFNLETLTAATKDFHEDNKLGEGGFGAVYKGTMPDGTEIAVKKLSLQSPQGKTEFENEVKLLARIQHQNLVNLLGCCTQGSESLLVYEYLVNKSLDQILFDPQRSGELDWQKRFNIIVGVARGLLFLHDDSRPRIIHRDVKASNILLDEQMNPKIADFGIARLFLEDETHVSTRVAGTYGYLAPEYAMHGQLSDKADVYSFGVLLLEIVSGRKNTDIEISDGVQGLLELAWECYSRGNSVDVIDKGIVEDCPTEECFKCIHVGLLCIQEEASLRPSMFTVYSMLSKFSFTNLPNPTKPSFVSVKHNGETCSI